MILINTLLILLLIYFVPVGFCLWYTKDNKIVDKKLCFKPKKWLSFVTGFVFSRFLKPHIFEQLILRIYNDKQCNDCYLNNKCSICGCDRTKFLVPWETCDKEDEIQAATGWGEMILNAEEYSEFRKKFPVEIEVKITYK